MAVARPPRAILFRGPLEFEIRRRRSRYTRRHGKTDEETPNGYARRRPLRTVDGRTSEKRFDGKAPRVGIERVRVRDGGGGDMPGPRRVPLPTVDESDGYARDVRRTDRRLRDVFTRARSVSGRRRVARVTRTDHGRVRRRFSYETDWIKNKKKNSRRK